MSRKQRRKQARTQDAPKAPVKVQAMDVFRAQAKASRQAVEGLVKTTDGYENCINRIGMHQQNMPSASHYDFELITRNRVQLEAAYRGSWIVGAVVDSVAEDMTREGITPSTSQDEEELKEFNQEFTRLRVWQSLCDGIKWGRLYGGGLSVMQIRGQDLATPLDPSTVGKGQFEGLAVFDRWMLNPILTPVIRSGPDMGLPKYYALVTNPLTFDPTTESPTGQLLIHHSRCFRHGGIKLPFFQAITEMMWDESILERLWDRLIAFDNATLSSGALIDRANTRMVKIENLREIASAGGEALEGLRAQMEFMRLAQSNLGLSMLDKLDEFQTETYTFTGLPEMVLQFGQQLSGASGVPMIRLFNQSPVGLNATGDGDIRMYYDKVKAEQEAKLRNGIDILTKVMWRSKFGADRPDDFEFTFNALWQMSAKDKSDIAKTNVDSVTAAHQDGLLSTPGAMKELRGQAKETGLFNNITDEDIAEAELEPAPLPDTAPTVGGGESTVPTVPKGDDSDPLKKPLAEKPTGEAE